VVRLMIKVTNAVHFAHCQGVIHRDLKPANILLDDNGEPKVTDFGLAKLRGNAEEPEIQQGNDTIPNSTALTRTGTHVGTPSYMAPEQYVANEMTPQVDIWALGVILYECLTGNRPFLGKRFENLQPQILFIEPPSMRSIRKEIPVALETIVQKCMKKSPAERYQSAAELAKDLERLQQPRNYVRTFARIGATAAFLVVPLVLYLVFGRHQAAESKPITMPTETKSSPSNEVYLNVVKPLQVQLSKGEKVDLIKPYVKPVGYRLHESTDIRLSQRQEDGSLTVFHNNLCYMELLPSVGIDRYRITTKIRHDYLAATRGCVGIYHCYQQAVNSVGTLRCCNLYALSDPSQLENEVVLKKPVFSSSFIGFIENGGQQHYFTESYPSHMVQRKDPPKGWHTLQIDVDHNDVKVHFDDKLLGSSNMTRRELNFQSQGPAKENKLLLQANDFRFSTSGAVGLYIQAGCISVQNFSIEPLP
jgi:Protein kinase domain